MSGEPILAFCHIAKTAGSTMTVILRSVYGIRHCRAVRTGPASSTFYSKRDLELALKLYPGLKAISGHPLRPHVDFGEHAERLRWTTLLRDPVERFYSAYRYFCLTKGVDWTFAEWCARQAKPNIQVNWIAGEPDVEKAKQTLESFFWVGDQHQLDTSLALLAARLGDPRFPTSTRHVVNPTPVSDIRYDRDLAIEHNRLDIELYDHFRSEIWPRQLAEHRPVAERPFRDGLASKFRRQTNRAYHGLVYKPLQARAVRASSVAQPDG